MPCLPRLARRRLQVSRSFLHVIGAIFIGHAPTLLCCAVLYTWGASLTDCTLHMMRHEGPSPTPRVLQR
ncbi:hypothetical protein LSTR_LSTR009702 [Laodelphax striatellus]|uniref:Uncharacterized protein n=1 Tax=Laodelphax striatellus TaxID=195883 RepID=A0A482WUB0_LAOST|nr:hypothetical protein LSTR_LSTR009702 [Laodelphax striatellus]